MGHVTLRYNLDRASSFLFLWKHSSVVSSLQLLSPLLLKRIAEKQNENNIIMFLDAMQQQNLAIAKRTIKVQELEPGNPSVRRGNFLSITKRETRFRDEC